jgi:putative hemolysin
MESSSLLTCRIIAPAAARRAGGFPSERHFDFSALRPLRARMVEVDALWLSPAARPQRAFGELGERLARYLIAEGHDFVFAAARIGIEDGGHAAASLHAAAAAGSCAPEDLRVLPRHRLEVEYLSVRPGSRSCPQLEGWLQLGAWVCGAPACDGASHDARIPLLLPLSRIRSRHARRFLAAAA